jgi:hypothetical protein
MSGRLRIDIPCPDPCRDEPLSENRALDRAQSTIIMGLRLVSNELVLVKEPVSIRTKWNSAGKSSNYKGAAP